MSNSPRRQPAAAAGFTLVELMISIAIVLILMLGINYVFSTSARTVSTGMALSTVGRDIRGARKTFENDFANAVAADEMPALLIHNEAIYAWRDRLDKLADRDNNPATFDVDGEEANGDEIDMGPQLAGVYNHRRHRIDRLSFFARHQSGEYARQTGDANTYVGPETSTEAWIWYGLLRLPDNGGTTYWKPGARNMLGPTFDERANPNNFFAGQWILGRKVTLLKDPASMASAGPGAGAGAPGAAVFAYSGANPLYAMSQVKNSGGAMNHETPLYKPSKPWLIQESRVDLAKATIASLTPTLAASGSWWENADPTTKAKASNRESADYETAMTASLNYLFWAKPFVDKSNFANSMADQTREAALVSPVFLRGCSQFIVEFAGDFFTQPEDFGVTGLTDRTPSGATRWYGLHRDLNNNAAEDPEDVNRLTEPPTPSSTMNGGVTPGMIEHETPGGSGIFAYGWGPEVATVPASVVRPTLIRITLELIDANGRLPDGQRIEFVYAMKP